MTWQYEPCVFLLLHIAQIGAEDAGKQEKPMGKF